MALGTGTDPVQNLIGAIETNDGAAFSEHLYQFSQVSDLDKWKVQLFLHIKKNYIQAAAPPPQPWAAHTSAPPPEGKTTDEGEIDLS